MNTFYLSHDIIQLFSQKTDNKYRYTLANRVYLYIIYVKSGRINVNQKSELIKFFNTSHSALNKAFSYLFNNNFITFRKGYISAKSNVNFKQSKTGVKFKFSLEDIKTSKSFTNRLYLSQFQFSAMQKGKRKEIDTIPQPIVEFTQNQSASYVAKFTGRHENTIKRRQNILKYDNLMKGINSEMSYQKSNCTVLTEKGFNIPTWQKPVPFPSQDDAIKSLNNLKRINKDVFGNCYTTTVQEKGWIVKPMPTTYSFCMEFKFDYPIRKTK